MKTADPAMPSVPDKPAEEEWPFEVRDVDDVLARIEQKAKRHQVRRRRIIRSAATAALVALVAIWAVPFVRDTSSVTTLAATRQNLTLTDGSHAELNARTRVQTDFRYGKRFVRLEQGEAFFSVAKDPAHPFLVQTPAGTIRVTGTKFNVRVTGVQAEVTLLEGAVTIEKQDAELGKLTPGDQFTSGENAPVVHRLSETEMENTIAWREGRLALDGRTLGDVIGRLAAYHGKQIDVASEVSSLRTGGSVSLEDLDAALAALQSTLPIRVVSAGGGSFRLLPRE